MSLEAGSAFQPRQFDSNQTLIIGRITYQNLPNFRYPLPSLLPAVYAPLCVAIRVQTAAAAVAVAAGEWKIKDGCTLFDHLPQFRQIYTK